VVKKPFKLTPQVPTEGQEQEQLISWSQAAQHRFPELALLYAIPNGVPINGPQKWALINAFKRRGLKKGVPDLCLPVQRIFEGARYAGMYLEMKRTTGGVRSADQDWWLSRLAEQGYFTATPKGFKEAAELLVSYLLGEKVCSDVIRA
jgi:hypothetical protein